MSHIITDRAGPLSRGFSAVLVTAIALASFTCGIARANLVLNPNFALYTGSAPKDFFSNVMPTDWTSASYNFVDAPNTATTGPGIPVYGPFPAPPGGGNFVEADGSSGLRYPIDQTINGLIAGQNYSVSFNQAAGQQLNDSGATTEQWQVSLGSQTQFSTLMSIPQGGVFPWNPQTMTFSASSTSEVLSFLAIGSGGGVPPIVFLDGVDVESTVPEPSAAVLLLAVGSVIALGRLGRRARMSRTNLAA